MLLSFFLFFASLEINSTESDGIYKICASGTDNISNCFLSSPTSTFVYKDNLNDLLLDLAKKSVKYIEISIVDSSISYSNNIEFDFSNQTLNSISLLKIYNGDISNQKAQFIKLKHLISKVPFQTFFLDGINILYNKESKQNDDIEFKSLILIQSSFLSFSYKNNNKFEHQKDYLSITTADLFTDSYSIFKSGNSISTAFVSDKYVKFLGFPKYQTLFNESTKSRLLKKSMSKKIDIITKSTASKSIIQKINVESFLYDYLFPKTESSKPISVSKTKKAKADCTVNVFSDHITSTCATSGQSPTSIEISSGTNILITCDPSAENISKLELNVTGNLTTTITFSGFSKFYTESRPSITNFVINHKDCSLSLSSSSTEEPVPFITLDPTTGVTFKPKRPRQLLYCMCLQSRFQRCKQSLECANDGVDPNNYVTGKEESFLDTVADYRTASTIRLIITHTGTETLNIDFKSFQIPKDIIFVSASTDITTQVCLRDDKLGVNSKTRFNVLFNRITNVIVDEVLKDLNLLVLQNSNLVMDANGTVENIFTDAYSIQNIQNCLTIGKIIAINSSSPLQLPPNKLYLNESSFLIIPSISGFPHIVVSGEYENSTITPTPEPSTDGTNLRILDDEKAVLTENGDDPGKERDTYSTSRCVKFSDEDDIYTMNFMLLGYNQTILVGKLAESNVEITVDSDTPVPSVDKAPEQVTNFLFAAAPFGMQVDFKNSIPAWMKFYFNSKEDSEIGSNSNIDYSNPIGVSLNLTIENGTSLINFGNLTGNFDLILMSSSTLQHFNNNALKDNAPLHYTADNISTLTLDFQESLTDIILTSQNIEFQIAGANENSHNISLPSIANRFRVTTITPNVTLSLKLDQGLINDNFDLYLLNNHTTVIFDNTFANQLYQYENMQKINLVHLSNNIDFLSDVNYVPYVNITENIVGVLFASNTDSNQTTDVRILSQMEAHGIRNTRTGPSISVSVESDVGYVCQEAILAQSVNFVGSPFKFAISKRARSSYTFNSRVTFVPRSRYPNNSYIIDQDGKARNIAASLLADSLVEDKTITFNADVVNFANGAINQTEEDGNKLPLTINANQLSASRLSSIDSSNFSPEGINVADQLDITDQTVNNIQLGSDNVMLTSSDGSKSPTITSPGNTAQFNINTNQKDVTVSCKDKEVPQNVHITAGSNVDKINFDKSWNGVSNAQDVTVTLQNPNTELNTEMLTLPNVTIQDRNGQVVTDKGQLNIVENKAKLTGQLGFFIFMGIFAFLLVLTIGFAIIGCTTLDKEMKKKKKSDEEEEENEKEKEKKEKKDQKAKEKAQKKEGEAKAKDEAKAAKDAAKEEKKKAADAKKQEKEAEKAAKKGEKADKKAEKDSKKAGTAMVFRVSRIRVRAME